MLQRQAELLPVPYFHIVFTLPEELNTIAVSYPKEVYDSLFKASWDTMKTFGSDHKYLGAKSGMTAILHTWGQQLWLHPHLHCIVPGGVLSPSGKWKETRGKGKYLYPKKAMSRVYRAKYVSALRATGVPIAPSLGKKLFEKDWVVYAKRPFGSPKSVIEYLGRYTHKIAISNHRLKDVCDGVVSFTYKDYRDGAKTKIAKLSSIEFLRRFCLHILPKGYRRIRHYGILASKNKATDLSKARAFHGLSKWQKVRFSLKDVCEKRLGFTLNSCPKCKRTTEVLEIIIPQRGPPITWLSK